MTHCTDRSYALNLRMTKFPLDGAVIVFESGRIRLNKANLNPDKSVLVTVESDAPNEDQIQACTDA